MGDGARSQMGQLNLGNFPPGSWTGPGVQRLPTLAPGGSTLPTGWTGPGTGMGQGADIRQHGAPTAVGQIGDKVLPPTAMPPPALAGGPAAPPTPAGGAQPMSYNPIAQPFGGPQIPGNPGSFWGPGSTYYASQQGSSLPPEIINQQGNAYIYGNGGWQAAGVNAQAPSQGPAPTPGYAGPNSIPGQQLTPFFGPQQQADLLAQLQPALAGASKGTHGQDNQRQILDTQLGQFFSNMAPTSDLGAPRGGYVPGYGVPQASLDYIPAGAEFGLENAILNRQKGPGSLRSAISSWASGLGNRPGPPGFTVPSAQQQGGGK